MRPRLDGQPVDLAVLRLATFATILVTRDLWSAPAFAALSPALREPAPGLAWLAACVPTDVRLSSVLGAGALAVAVAGSGLALIGLWTRPAAAAAALALLYLLGVPQLYGTVRHYHHLVWLAALLAAAPSGDALSFDAWRRGRRGEPPAGPGPSYGIALATAWALLACVFFFPGLWKLRAAGLPWITSDNLAQQMRWKWLQYGRVSPLRLDLHPLACRVAAAATIGFELSVPLLVWHRRTRLALLAGVIVFHVMTALVMFISFASLFCLHASLVPWHRLRRGGSSPGTPAPRSGRANAAPVIVGALLVAGAALAGARGAVQAWPFACYPTFQHLAPAEMPVLEAELVGADGVRTPLPTRPTVAGIDGQRQWALGWSLAAAPQHEALLAWLRLVAGRDPRLGAARTVEVYRGLRPVDPARWAEPARQRQLVATVPASQVGSSITSR